MTLHVYEELEQGTPEWLAVRRGIVTASVVGKLITPTLKVADNETARALTATLAAERIAGFTEDNFVNADMWRGIESEPIARDLYAKQTETTVEQVGFMVIERTAPWDPNELVRSVDEASDVRRFGYSPDGLVGADGLIEIKAPRAKTHVLTILADAVPAHYMAQCQAGLYVSGREWIDFVSYVGGMPLYVKRVHPDEAWFDAIDAAWDAFETNAARIVADYTQATKGLAPTERVLNLEMSL